MSQIMSTINKNSEREIGVQPEDLKSKAVSHWLLPQPQSKLVILPPGISDETVSESCLLPFYNPL